MRENESTTLLEWRPEFSIGLPEVDTEHRDIIRLINALYDSCLCRDEPSAVAGFLGETYAWIHAHFALEERLMRDIGYDGYAPHKAEHERLLAEIGEVIEACETGAAFDADGFGAVLAAWFAGHFRTQDARLYRRLG